MGGDHRKPPAWTLGQLAATWKLAGDGTSYEIESIVAGDPWEPGADSPLNAIGVEAKPGERIVAINGQPVSRTTPPQALLVHQANAKVELTLDGPSGKRTAVATTLHDDVPARYRRPVLHQHVVHGATEGVGRKDIEGRLAGGKRHDVGIGGVPHQIPQRRVRRLDGSRGDLAAPGEGGAVVARRRDEGAASDIATRQPLGLEVAIGRDDGGAADGERGRKVAFRRQAEARRQRPAADAAFDQFDNPAVERPRPRDV